MISEKPNKFWLQMVQSLGFEDERTFFLTLIGEGKTTSDIANLLGFSPATIRTHIRKLNIENSSNLVEVKIRQQSLNMGFDSFKQAIEFLTKDDWSMGAIGDLFGCTSTTIKNKIAGLGLKHLIRPQGGRNSALCANQKWDLRAHRLGFNSEAHMLSTYEGRCSDLYKALVMIIKRTEFPSKLPCKQTLSARYKKYNIAPYVFTKSTRQKD